MYTNTKFIMLSALLAASNAAAHVAVYSSAGLTAIPIVTTKPAGASSSSAASTVSYITPTTRSPTSTGYPGGPLGSQNGGQHGPPIEGAFPSGAPNGQSGGNGGQPYPSYGEPGSSGPGGASTGSQYGGNSHGAPYDSEGPMPSGTSQNGFPGGGFPHLWIRPIQRYHHRGLRANNTVQAVFGPCPLRWPVGFK
ncbi:hypothetical protein BJ912DRAFT_925511 [Pholiota molesta]|nr:hypothetical protein BJ912DRAFT_925511 [Pholiota molesta]